MGDYRNNKDSSSRKRKFMFKKKICKFCNEGIYYLDYKNTNMLGKFVMPVGKILPRRITGTCAKHQRMVAQAIKKARHAALLPYKK